MRVLQVGTTTMPRPRTRSKPTGKRAVNLSVPARLVDEARVHEINLSATLEHALEEALRCSRRERWIAENTQGIAAYNEHVDEHGAFSDKVRSF
jgi:antitoxin CcdA